MAITKEIVVGSSPRIADLAIAPIDSHGSKGMLNSFILTEYGYSVEIFGKLADQIKQDYAFVKGTQNQFGILFVVTIGDEVIDKLIKRNLFNALTKCRKNIEGRKIWLPLIGTGKGGLTLKRSYEIIIDVLNELKFSESNHTHFYIAFPDNEEGKELYKKIVLWHIPPSPSSKSFNRNSQFYLAGSVWDGKNDQAERFFNQNIWINGKEEKYVDLVNKVEEGDFIFLKSTFFANDASYLRIKGVGIVLNNPRDGENLQVDWRVKGIKIDIEDLGKYRRTFSRVMPDDLSRILDAVGQENLVNAGIMQSETTGGVLSTLISNPLQNPRFGNDSSLSDIDLLGFENDIRSFALLIALKELKPPLAIALFGNWGAGKSFFIHNLHKKVNHLSKYQGFEKLEIPQNDYKGEKPFCEGIVQISFNAWAYMDTNLWASLVSNIFEKLDEYIKEQTNATGRVEDARKILSKQLTVVSEEKNMAIDQKEKLSQSLNTLFYEIATLEKEKEAKLKELTANTTRELLRPILGELTLSKTVETQLEQYGLDKSEIAESSPDELFEEATSWFAFVRNLLRFDRVAVGSILLALTVLFLILWDPNLWVESVVRYIDKKVICFFTLVSPILIKVVTAYQRYVKLYQPLKKHRDLYNRKVKDFFETNENNIRKKQIEIEAKSRELVDYQNKLRQIELEIGLLDHELKHSVIRKAFFDFIQEKSVDQKYERSLSIISTIRKDFETLSELFREYNGDQRPLDPDERKKFDEKKELSDALRGTMNKPLDRIVLYVDDLDRCSEDRVIEVLEAVNLLMAFPLFVVVVGVDPRWVRNALIKKYTLQFTGILNNTDLKDQLEIEPIQVCDYLEKIFQIPFHLREATQEGVHQLIEKQLEGQIVQISEGEVTDENKATEQLELVDEIEVNENDAMHFVSAINEMNIDSSKSHKLVHFQPVDLKISQQELGYLKEFSWLVGPNPRALKRFVNIYRIIRAHENLQYEETTAQSCFAVIAFLAALGAGQYKNTANRFYQSCNHNNEHSLNQLLDICGLTQKILTVEKLSDLPSVYKRFPDYLIRLKGESFAPYTSFVSRFTFEYVEQ